MTTLSIASAKRYIEGLSNEGVLEEFQRTWTDREQVARAIRKVMLDALEGEDTAALAIDQIAKVCALEAWTSPAQVLAAVCELRKRSDAATAQLQATPVMSMADRAKLASIQSIEDRDRNNQKILAELEKQVSSARATAQADVVRLIRWEHEMRAGVAPQASEHFAFVADFLDQALRLNGAPGRPNHLKWNGTEWVDDRCGCRYHPDDDNMTHGGGPHVHPCERHAHAEPPSTEVFIEVLAKYRHLRGAVRHIANDFHIGANNATALEIQRQAREALHTTHLTESARHFTRTERAENESTEELSAVNERVCTEHGGLLRDCLDKRHYRPIPSMVETCSLCDKPIEDGQETLSVAHGAHRVHSACEQADGELDEADLYGREGLPEDWHWSAQNMHGEWTAASDDGEVMIYLVDDGLWCYPSADASKYPEVCDAIRKRNGKNYPVAYEAWSARVRAASPPRRAAPTVEDIEQGLAEAYGRGYRLTRNAAHSGWRISTAEQPYQMASSAFHATLADAIRVVLPSWNPSTWPSRRRGEGGAPKLGDG